MYVILILEMGVAEITDWLWPSSEAQGLILLLLVALALGPTLGQRGSGQSQAQIWPSFQGFLIAGGWESQGNPPSSPTTVIWPSMCQSRWTQWQAHDDMAIVFSPLCCRDISEARKHPSDYGISVSTGMLSLAVAVRLTMGRQHVCELCKVYCERLTVFWHTSLHRY